MTSITFLRHGQARNNVERVLTGRRPGVPLTEHGVKQAEWAARSLASMDITAVYSSPVQRTMQTAEIVARHNSLEVTSDDRLIEIDMGRFTGMKYDDLIARYGNVFQRFYRDDAEFAELGVETFSSVRARVLGMAQYVLKRHPDENTLLVTHMDPIKAMLSTVLEVSPDGLHRVIIANGSLNVFPVDGEGNLSLGTINAMESSRLPMLW